MPKSNKKRVESGTDSSSDSGPDDLVPAKKSKSDNSSGLKNDSGETYWELDRMRRVTVREFKNKTYIDIREFYEKDGKSLPGKKGISMSVAQWGKLKTLIDDVDTEVSKIS